MGMAFAGEFRNGAKLLQHQHEELYSGFQAILAAEIWGKRLG
jgi:hypothetical protein